MLPDHPPRVLAVGPRLRPEARGVRRHLQGKRPGGEDLVPHDVRHRHLRGGNEEVVGPRHAEEILLELRELPGAEERRAVRHERGKHFEVSVLPSMDVEHEVDERPLQQRPRPLREAKPPAGDLDRPVEVEDVQRRAEVDVVLDREREDPRGPPRPHDGVVLLPRAVRNRGIRHVREDEEKLLHLPLDRREFRFRLLEPRRKRLHPLHEFRRVLLLPPEPADLPGSGVALRPHPLHFEEPFPARLVQRNEAVEGEGGPALPQRFFNDRDVFPDEFQVEHLVRPLPLENGDLIPFPPSGTNFLIGAGAFRGHSWSQWGTLLPFLPGKNQECPPWEECPLPCVRR